MSFPRALGLSTMSLLPLLVVSGTAYAGGEAKVSARIAELRVSPSDEARTRIKLGAGRSVTVLGTSDDGGWVKIRGQMERGEDKITFEGWVDATELSGANLGGAKKMQESEVAESSGNAAGGDNWDFGDDAAKSEDESVAKTSEPEPWDTGDSAPAEPATSDWGDSGSSPDSSSSESSAESSDGW